jgi:hypothetical protein
MSDFGSFMLLVRLPDTATRDRLALYLDGATRPDFPEEVPEQEADWVDAFEPLPVPELEVKDDDILIAYFDGDTTDELDLPRICEAVNLFAPQRMLSYTFLGDTELFEEWQAGDPKLIWSVVELDDPDDDLRYNRNLDKPTQQELQRLLDRDSPDRALMVLARKP